MKEYTHIKIGDTLRNKKTGEYQTLIEIIPGSLGDKDGKLYVFRGFCCTRKAINWMFADEIQ